MERRLKVERPLRKELTLREELQVWWVHNQQARRMRRQRQHELLLRPLRWMPLLVRR